MAVSLKVPDATVTATKRLDSDFLELSRYVGLSDDFTKTVAGKLGMPEDLAELAAVHPRTITMSTLEDFMGALDGLEGLTFFRKNLLKTLHQLAVALCTSPTSSSAPTSIARSSGEGLGSELALLEPKGPGGRKVKLSGLIDPMDETECMAATPSMLDQWYDQYKKVKKGPPLVAKDPTADQLIAMHTRVVVHGLEPYGDFSILTPHGRRMQKRLKYRSWIPQGDGTYSPLEVPGPPSLEMWEACWAVYETILLMLTFPSVNQSDPEPVLDLIAAETYVEAFRALARENAECWFLCCRAEDRARAEHVPRVARKLKDKNGTKPSWSEVYIAVAEDTAFWDQEVRRPALQFLARNKRPVLDDEVVPGVPSPHPQERGPRKRGRKGKHGNTVNLTPNPETQIKGKAKGGGKGNKGAHPRKDAKGRYMTTKDGQEICFNFAAGGADRCPAPCRANRAHVCQKCLQPHQNTSPSCSFNS